MMHGNKGNSLIVIENGQIVSYTLDNRNAWEIGRVSGDNIPDIKLHVATISRKHGKLQNMDGVWFYLDGKRKNGTIYNHKPLSTGLNGRVKPVMLNHGDTFVFGCGETEVINCKTVWAMFVTYSINEDWRIVDSKHYKQLQFISGEGSTTLTSPEKGFVFEKENGVAIYMGDLTYLLGDIEVIGC